MRRLRKVFGGVTLLGSVGAGAYYYLFMRSRRPQVELYFDDGSMLALQGNAAEAEPFVKVAQEVLTAHPVAG